MRPAQFRQADLVPKNRTIIGKVLVVHRVPLRHVALEIDSTMVIFRAVDMVTSDDALRLDPGLCSKVSEGGLYGSVEKKVQPN